MKKRALTTICILLTLFTFAQPKAFEVKITGKGQPVIFLPGFTCPGEVWDETLSQLDNGYQTYQFTYAGFGGIAPIDMPWYETISSELALYLEKNKLKKAILVGHSMGGMLAIDLAAKLPGQIDKVVLVDALPCIREVMMPQVKSEDLFYESPYNQQVLAMSDSAFVQTATYMAHSMSNNQGRHQELTNWILISDRETYVYGYTDLLKLDLRDKLKQIKAPVLILAAGFPSKELVMETVTAQFLDLEKKEIKIAESSRHFIMFDQPEWLYAELNGFIK